MATIHKYNLIINYEYIPSIHSSMETIILAHGLGLDMKSWEYIIPSLQNQFNILRFDFREHGGTTGSLLETNWITFYEDFTFLLTELKIDTYHFIGHGLGGHFGVELLSSFPNSAKSFILLSTTCYFPKNIGLKAIDCRKNLVYEQDGYPIKVAKMMSSQIFYPNTKEKEEYLIKAFSKVSVESYFNILLYILDSLSLEKLKNIKIPVLLLFGEYDKNYPPNLTNLSASYFPDCKAYIIPNSSNMVQVDQPELTAQLINDFLMDIQSADISHVDLPPHRSELDNAILKIIETGQQNIKKGDLLRIDALSSFAVFLNGKKIEGKWQQRKAKEIFCYIALNKFVNRERLYDVFWEEVPLKKAQNHLRVALNHLKQLLGTEAFDDIFSITNNTIETNCDVTCDLIDLENKLNEILEETNYIERNKKNNILIANLPDIIMPSFYSDYFIDLRNDIENKIVQIQQSLLEFNKSKFDYTNAILNLKILNKCIPDDESIIMQLISLLKKVNNYHEAQIWEEKLKKVIH
ncbi:alpha/beta hydrolase [Calidifontibacillus oryziterrae]|uniref:alpha/beta hydrolase n=1 Tax=Calidifontibacillus oryziterrae TaxID=1191699 RepID=UPI0003191337|nr:alpha/beta hydrolase [Calidifontibacillus oryziterrae]